MVCWQYFLLLSLLVTCCRDGYWNIRASVHASVIQIFPPGASHQTAMHQNLTEPVSRPRIIALLLLLVVTLQCSAGSRGPPWRWSSSTASLWACTNPARTRAFATKSAKCWRFVMLLHRCFIIFDTLLMPTFNESFQIIDDVIYVYFVAEMLIKMVSIKDAFFVEFTDFYHCYRLRLVWLEKVAIYKRPGTSWIASLWSLGKIHAIVYHIGLYKIWQCNGEILFSALLWSVLLLKEELKNIISHWTFNFDRL